jgi:hypothetical protein
VLAGAFTVPSSETSEDRFGNSEVAQYNATTGTLINPNFIALYENQGLAVSGNNLFVANYNNAGVISECNATTGALINANFITGITYDADELAIAPTPTATDCNRGNSF